jgi:hypothetical protein
MTSPIPIPRTCDANAAGVLHQIESETGLSEEQGQELLSWLEETDFETDSFWIGELAARLIRDRGSEALKALVMSACGAATDWQLYFFLIALSKEVDWPPLDRFLQAARHSSRPVICAFADKLWHELRTESDEAQALSGAVTR